MFYPRATATRAAVNFAFVGAMVVNIIWAASAWRDSSLITISFSLIAMWLNFVNGVAELSELKEI